MKADRLVSFATGPALRLEPYRRLHCAVNGVHTGSSNPLEDSDWPTLSSGHMVGQGQNLQRFNPMRAGYGTLPCE